MSKHTVGKCSNCLGPVSVPVVWFGPKPLPACENCGAVATGETVVLPMGPAKRVGKKMPLVSLGPGGVGNYTQNEVKG